MKAFVVVEPGPLASVQDLGRPGLARLGVSAGGAADRGSLMLANRLVGNDPGAAAIEVTAGGFVARAAADLVVAVAGASGPVSVDGRGAGTNAPLLWPSGADLEIGRPGAGLRAYLAVAGGIDAPVVLGSRAYHALAGLGAPLAAGERIAVGAGLAALPVADHAPLPAPARDLVTLDVLPGPRDDWFTAGSLAALREIEYSVTAELDRTGIRLDGPPLIRTTGEELPSEGMVRGAVQVPASGRPILFLADHPATGGYPVLGVLTPAACDLAAQLAPGMHVRLRLPDPRRPGPAPHLRT